MKIAIIVLLALGAFDWTINGKERHNIRTLINVAALICFTIYSY